MRVSHRESLLSLTDIEWAVLRVRLRELEHELPPSSQPRAAQVDALLALAQATGRTEQVERELHRVRTLTGQEPPENWLEVLLERHDKVRVLGLFAGDGDQWLSLRELFVDLDISRIDAAHRMGRELFDPASDALGAARSVDEALLAIGPAKKRGLVLVGLPGSGKTTLLQRRFTDALRAFRLDPREPFPLLLRCATLQHIGVAKLRPRDLPLVASVESAADGFGAAGATLVQQHPQRLLVLLDGLDELRSPDDRLAVAQWLAREIELWPGSSWILSTRTAAWGEPERRALSGQLEPFRLLNLRDRAITDFVQRWYRLMAEVEAPFAPEAERPALMNRATDTAADLLAQLRRRDEGSGRSRLARLSGNPLTLTLMCIVRRRFERLPRRRGQLYGIFLEILLRGRYAPGARGGLEPDDGARLLGPLAWRMQDSGEKDSPKELPRAEVLAELEKTRPTVPRVARLSPEELLRLLTRDSPALYSADGENVQFLHLTLQEYLAMQQALALNGARELAARAADPRWEEPILLAMAEPGLRRAFYEAALVPGVGAIQPLLRECLAEGEAEAEPFARFLDSGQRDWAGLWRVFLGVCAGRLAPAALRQALGLMWSALVSPPSVEDLSRVLELFVADAPPPVREAAKRLAARQELRLLALRVAGELEVAAGERPLSPTPGQLWRCEALGMDFVWVPPGRFWMGAQRGGWRSADSEAFDDESPVHEVVIGEGFWLGRFPVTVAQYQLFVDAGGRAPDSLTNAELNAPDQPITEVDWDDAAAWCAWASGVAGALLTLPLEAEWEWAARGEDGRKYPWGEAAPSLERAWYGAYGLDVNGRLSAERGEHRDTVRGPAAVGGRPEGRGPFGAEDQAGNVWEWCADVYEPYTDARRTLSGVGERYDKMCHLNDKRRREGDDSLRVLRGGSWFDPARWLRSAFRDWLRPEGRVVGLGFRVVLRPVEPR